MGHSLTQEKKMWIWLTCLREWKEKSKRWKVGIWGRAFLWLRIGGGVKIFSYGGLLLNEKVWDLFLPTIIEVLKNFGGPWHNVPPPLTIVLVDLIVPVYLMSELGIICHKIPNSRSTSAIEGLASVTSSQHLRAKFKNFTTQYQGYKQYSCLLVY